MKSISTSTTKDPYPELPESFKCPICGDKVIIEDITSWEQKENGSYRATEISVDCIKSRDVTDIENIDFCCSVDAWLNSHWQTPYIDWLPLQVRVEEWHNENFEYPESEFLKAIP